MDVKNHLNGKLKLVISQRDILNGSLKRSKIELVSLELLFEKTKEIGANEYDIRRRISLKKTKINNQQSKSDELQSNVDELSYLIDCLDKYNDEEQDHYINQVAFCNTK